MERCAACIGSLEATRPWARTLPANARAAAFQDPRFSEAEAPSGRAAASRCPLLSAPKPIAFGDEAELLAQVRPGEDGLIRKPNGKRATFLRSSGKDCRTNASSSPSC